MVRSTISPTGAGPSAQHGLEDIEFLARVGDAELVQWPLSAAREQLEEPLGAGIEHAAVDRHRRAGQYVDPGDRHAQRQIGRRALQFARDLLHLHRGFLACPRRAGIRWLAWRSMAEGTTDGYAHALRREILRSEQQRMRALAIILAVLLCSPR